jgi:hypothetical protein
MTGPEDRPQNTSEARELMLDWAGGKRSWINLGPHPPYTPEVIAAMDAAETQKWAAVYTAFATIDVTTAALDAKALIHR